MRKGTRREPSAGASRRKLGTVRRRVKGRAKAGAAGARKPVPRAGARKTGVEIPSILLQGDIPVAKAVAVERGPQVPGGTPVGISMVEGEEPGLPEAYGTQELMLVARDPRTLYAHWDLTRQQQRQYMAKAANGRLMLRVRTGSLEGPVAAQVELEPDTFHCFIAVPRGGCRYQAELGYTDQAGVWSRISGSGAVITPPEAPEWKEPVKFITIPAEKPFAEFAQAGSEPAGGPQREPEAWVLAGAGRAGESRKTIGLEGEGLGAAQGRTLVAQVAMALPASHLGSEALAAVPAGPGEHGISSPGGMEQGPQEFWFNVEAELVIYGATEPGAKLVLGGEEVKLRPDGTFSCRIALPDGQRELTAEAVSVDRRHVRIARLSFARRTEYSAAEVPNPNA